jgi:hypothetical protein
MTKKKKSAKPAVEKDPEHYEFITAKVDCGQLTYEYRLNRKSAPKQSIVHDEDVESWSADEIKDMVKQFLSVEGNDPVEVIVEYT